MNIRPCGMLPMYLPAVCFDSISAVTAKYLFQLLTVTACYIPQGMSVGVSTITLGMQLHPSEANSELVI